MKKLILGISIILVVAVAVTITSRGPLASGDEKRPTGHSRHVEPIPEPRLGADPGPANLAPPESGQKASPSSSDPDRINLKKLREAVLSGDPKAVNAVGGNLAPGDADAIFALLFEIPMTGPDGPDIKSTLVNLVQKTPGDAASKHLLWMVKEPDFLLLETWVPTVVVLGQRKNHEAVPFLESLAFPAGEHPTSGTAQTRTYSGVMALLQLDSASYLPQLAIQVRTLPEKALWPYVSALSYSAEAGVDIGLSVPDLQLRFTALTQQHWGSRTWIARALENYWKLGKSESTKNWLIQELKRLIDADSVEADTERKTYVDMLKRLEGR